MCEASFSTEINSNFKRYFRKSRRVLSMDGLNQGIGGDIRKNTKERGE